MRKRDVSVKTSGEVAAPGVGLEPEVDATVVRGRPGRRTVAEKRDAVMRLLSGRATADQLARQYGVLPETCSVSETPRWLVSRARWHRATVGASVSVRWSSRSAR